MRKKNSFGKLSLIRQTIADLNNEQMISANAGADITTGGITTLKTVELCTDNDGIVLATISCE